MQLQNEESRISRKIFLAMYEAQLLREDENQKNIRTKNITLEGDLKCNTEDS